MPDADVTPNGNWDVAQDAAVQVIGGALTNGVPIIVVPWTPADITIKQRDFPNGVVILNETVYAANHASTESTSGNPTFNLKIEPRTTPRIPVNIIENAGWPSGEVILCV